MQRERCSGVWVPLVTPFRDDGRLDLAPIPDLVDWLLAAGVRGLLALGTTGEAPHLQEDEALDVVRATVRAVAGRVPVLAGSGRASTQATLATGRAYAHAGVEGLLVLTPSYYRARMDGEALYRHYEAVAAASPVPVFVYHMPEVTGLDLDAEILSRLVAIPNVWGFKDSSASGGPLAGTLQQSPTCGWVGSGTRLVEGLDAGAAGGILAVAHLVPEVCVAIDSAWRRGDRDTAQVAQRKATAMTLALRGWNVAGIKYGLGQRGLAAGSPRAPLAHLPEDVRQHVQDTLRRVIEPNAAGFPG